MAVNDDINAIDRLVYFGHNSYDLTLPATSSMSPAPFHDHQHLEHAISGNSDMIGGVGLTLNCHNHYFNDHNMDSSMLGVSNSLLYDAPFPSMDIASSQLNSDVESVHSISTMVPSSVVDPVISSAIIASAASDAKIPTPADRQNLSTSASPTDDKKSCTCKDCGKVFNSVWYLKQHAVKHSSERPFKCKYCHKTYRFRSNLYQHKCPLRDRASELALVSIGATNGQLDLEELRKISSSTVTNSPLPSSESSSSAEIIAAANVTRTRKRRAWPPLISPPVSTPSALNGLDKQHTRVKIRKGNQAEFATADGVAATAGTFVVGNRCITSMPLSAGSPMSPTSLAQSSTKRGGGVVATQLSDEEVQKFLDRHKDKLHKCPRCKSVWPSREYLTRHMEWHNDDSSRFRCVHCSETFVDEQRFGLHKQNHTPSSLHVCGRCRGKFCTRVALKKHSRRCSLVDAKINNALMPGRICQRSNSAVTNGFRHMLFIDPTPPPSPNGTTNGSVENHENGGAGDNEEYVRNSTHSVPGQDSSSASSAPGKGGEKLVPGAEGNGIGHSTQPRGQGDGIGHSTRSINAINGSAPNSNGVSNVPVTISEMKNEVHSSHFMPSSASNGDNIGAVLQSEGAKTPVGGPDQLPSSPVHTGWNTHGHGHKSIPSFDVPNANLFSVNHLSTISDHSHHSPIYGTPPGDGSTFHSNVFEPRIGIGDDLLYGNDENMHNGSFWDDVGGDGNHEEAFSAATMTRGRSHQCSGPDLRSMKSAAPVWQDDCAPLLTDTPSVAFDAVSPSQTTTTMFLNDALLLLLLHVHDPKRNFEAFFNQVPQEFGADGSHRSPTTETTVLICDDPQNEQFSTNPLHAVVPLQMSQMDVLQRNDASITGEDSETTPNGNQGYSEAMDIQGNGYASQQVNSTSDNQHFCCESCGCSMVEDDDGGGDRVWIPKHHSNCPKASKELNQDQRESECDRRITGVTSNGTSSSGVTSSNGGTSNGGASSNGITSSSGVTSNDGTSSNVCGDQGEAQMEERDPECSSWSKFEHQ